MEVYIQCPYHQGLKSNKEISDNLQKKVRNENERTKTTGFFKYSDRQVFKLFELKKKTLE